MNWLLRILKFWEWFRPRKPKKPVPRYTDDITPPPVIDDWDVISDLAIIGRGKQITVDCAAIDFVGNHVDRVNGNMWIQYPGFNWETWDFTRQGVHLRHFPLALKPGHPKYEEAKRENWPQLPRGSSFDICWSCLIRDKRRNGTMRSRTVHYDS